MWKAIVLRWAFRKWLTIWVQIEKQPDQIENLLRKIANKLILTTELFSPGNWRQVVSQRDLKVQIFL